MPSGETRKQPPGSLCSGPRLSAEEVHEIEKLAEACLAVDGGRLKLEWRTLKSAQAGPRNYFWWIGPAGELIGFLGIYGHRPDQVELCGMVHPAARRQGVFSRLYEAVVEELVEQGMPEALLVVDRVFGAGAAFARSVGGEIEHSEHRMVLVREPGAHVADPLVTVRPALHADQPFVVAAVAEAFDMPSEGLSAELEGTLVIELGGEPVGTVRISRGDDSADIYGFAVVPRFQGRGIGRQVLSEIVTGLSRENLARVGLEVSCSNDGALRLYERCGFEATGTEDYYAVALAPTLL